MHSRHRAYFATNDSAEHFTLDAALDAAHDTTIHTTDCAAHLTTKCSA